MTRWRVELRNGEYVVVTDDGRNQTHVGTDDMCRQWAEWYVSRRNMPDDTVPWPLTGLYAFENREGDAALFVHDGEPVGTLGWNGLEWWFYPLTFDLSTEGEPLHIDVDYDQRRRFAEEREEVVAAPAGGVRDARTAELNARIRLHRDETRELALMRARLEAKRVWRRRLY